MQTIKWWLLNAISACVLFGFTLSTSLADAGNPIWRFEVIGSFTRLTIFSSAFEKIYPTEKSASNECVLLDREPEKDEKHIGVVIFCKRTVENLSNVNNAFFKASTPVKDEAGIVPLQLVTTSATPADCGGTCSGCKCANNDGGLCTAQSVGGNIICLHRTHQCTPR